MQQDTDPASPPRRNRVVITIAVVAVLVIFIALHLTGVLGPR
jgi:hypothetical protein